MANIKGITVTINGAKDDKEKTGDETPVKFSDNVNDCSENQKQPEEIQPTN